MRPRGALSALIFALLLAAAPALADPVARPGEDFLNQGVRAALGRDGPPDFAAAAAAFRQAAEAGSPEGAFNLGELYRAGKGVPKDLAQAAAWFGRAADAGFAPARFYLAVLLFNGAGVPKDQPRAIDLLQRAAGQGLPQAQKALDELRRAAERMTKP